MRVIEVQEPGLLTTVQDLGREGFGPMGVSPSGAADAISLRIANRIAGNPEGAAGLEMTLLGATFGPTRSGARCYLCVQGGIAVTPFLGSASTHLLSGLGGHEGRPLRKGDMLRIGDAGGSYRKRTLAAKALERLAPRKILRVTPGPQSDWFSEAAQKLFYGSTFRVAEESNRMGLRLEGAAIQEGAHGEMITEGVSLGAVQIPAGGLPIILFVEQQTTGGYAKIANVISADFRSLGQLRPRDKIRFERVDWETARGLLMDQEKLFASPYLIVVA